MTLTWISGRKPAVTGHGVREEMEPKPHGGFGHAMLLCEKPRGAQTARSNALPGLPKPSPVPLWPPLPPCPGHPGMYCWPQTPGPYTLRLASAPGSLRRMPTLCPSVRSHWSTTSSVKPPASPRKRASLPPGSRINTCLTFTRVSVPRTCHNCGHGDPFLPLCSSEVGPHLYISASPEAPHRVSAQ